MKKVFFFMVVSILFTTTILAQRTYSIEQYKKLAGKGKTDMQIDDSTVQPVLVKWNWNHKYLKIREYGIRKTLKGDAVKAPPAPVLKENVVVTTTTTGSVTTTGVDTTFPGPAILLAPPTKPVVATDNIIVNGVKYAPYTGAESPASSPGVAKTGFLVQGGKWYKIIGEVSGETAILNGKKYSPFYPTANERPMDVKGKIKDGYIFQNGKWWKEMK